MSPPPCCTGRYSGRSTTKPSWKHARSLSPSPSLSPNRSPSRSQNPWQHRHPPPPPPPDPALLRERYLARLLAHIEREKFYPGAARRRGIEGEVVIDFTLGCDGRPGPVQARRGHKLLRGAATSAVERAHPLPTPPPPSTAPWR
ncbi:MAG: TonB family protein [Candidatus Sedimenticola endophacoides]